MNDKEKELLNYEDVEIAMLKSCLLFSGLNKPAKRELILQKKTLGLVLSKGSITREEIYSSIIGTYSLDENERKSVFDSAIDNLKKQKLIDLDDGMIHASQKAVEDANHFLDEFKKGEKAIIEDVYSKVATHMGTQITNAVQVSTNIKECLKTYFCVSSISFLGIDDDKYTTNTNWLKSCATNGLGSNGDKIGDHIINELGQLLANPTEPQKKILEAMARTAVTSCILGKDCLLRNFKLTALKQKSFVLDTDIVLYCITSNTERGNIYRKMLDKLAENGCKLFIPMQVIDEVFHHAEAAVSRYSYEHDIIERTEKDYAINLSRNVFIEDYLKGGNCGTVEKWKNYIQNFYAKDLKDELILETVKYTFKDNVKIQMPLDQSVINKDDYNRLYEHVLEATRTSLKAAMRQEERNEEVAKVDTILYLLIRECNRRQSEKEGKQIKGGALSFDYYILSNSYRAYNCAREIGLSSEFICNPRAMVAYLAETGNLDSDTPILDMFDNTFLSYVADTSWDEIKEAVAAGIDVKGKSIVRLRLDFKHLIHKLFTSSTPEDMLAAYSSLKNEGFTFSDSFQRIVDRNIKLESENAEKQAEIERKDKELEIAKKRLDKIRYENHVKNFTRRKGKR